LVKVLRADATIEAPPFTTWVEGRPACSRYLRDLLTDAGEYRMIPTSANGQPAAIAYRRGRDGAYRSFGVAVLAATTRGIAQIVAFCDPRLVTVFGFGETLPGRSGRPGSHR
jgi:RNA polymerase sigma-70 factor (ECF subfamily)